MTKQCSSCGGFCGKVCQRENLTQPEQEPKIGCVNHDCDQCKAQPEQEPCGWQFFQGGKWQNGMETNNHRANTEAAGIPVRDVYPSPQRTEQEPVQKPVAVVSSCTGVGDKGVRVKWLGGFPQIGDRLYFHPPQRTWVGLTKNERLELYTQFANLLESDDCEYEKAIEAILKEKNT
jgi:hypothetical protein